MVIVDTVAPGFLDSLASFHKTYVKADDPVAASEKLKKRLVDEIKPSILMRRMKEEHLDGLPEKIIKKYPTEMSQQQASEYSDYVKVGTRGTDRSDTSILEILQKLRKISLFTGNVGAEGLTDELIEQSTSAYDAKYSRSDSIRERRIVNICRVVATTGAISSLFTALKSSTSITTI